MCFWRSEVQIDQKHLVLDGSESNVSTNTPDDWTIEPPKTWSFSILQGVKKIILQDEEPKEAA